MYKHQNDNFCLEKYKYLGGERKQHKISNKLLTLIIINYLFIIKFNSYNIQIWIV